MGGISFALQKTKKTNQKQCMSIWPTSAACFSSSVILKVKTKNVLVGAKTDLVN